MLPERLKYYLENETTVCLLTSTELMTESEMCNVKILSIKLLSQVSRGRPKMSCSKARLTSVHSDCCPEVES